MILVEFDHFKIISPAISPTLKCLEKFATEGLRTLLLAKKVIDPEEYQRWSNKYKEACLALDDRDTKIEIAQAEIEQGLQLVGSTAIEDKLQDQVGYTIETLKKAGIKVWVLTGDKVETAINIAFSCNLLNGTYVQLLVDGSTETEVKTVIENYISNGV